MSLKSWKEEFYPKPASRPKSDKGALLHSLRKWNGLKPINRRKHGIKLAIGLNLIDHDGNDFFIDTSTCALCRIHCETLGHCFLCPLTASLGHPCDREGGPYIKWTEHSNPNPMIKALGQALEQSQARRKPAKANTTPTKGR